MSSPLEHSQQRQLVSRVDTVEGALVRLTENVDSLTDDVREIARDVKVLTRNQINQVKPPKRPWYKKLFRIYG